MSTPEWDPQCLLLYKCLFSETLKAVHGTNTQWWTHERLKFSEVMYLHIASFKCFPLVSINSGLINASNKNQPSSE